MRRMAVTLSMLALTLATSASAAVELGGFDRKVSRFAGEDISGPAKTLCVCQNGTSLDGVVGYLRRQTVVVGGANAVRLSCMTPRFGPTGDAAFVDNCTTFAPLAR